MVVRQTLAAHCITSLIAMHVSREIRARETFKTCFHWAKRVEGIVVHRKTAGNHDSGQEWWTVPC